jgi:hypothetical protein
MNTTHFRTTNVRPENAVLVYSLDLTKNKVAVWAMNGASLPLLILFGGLFLAYLRLVRPGIGAALLSVPGIDWLFLVGSIVAFVALIALHELVHGAFFWVYTRSRPVFGLRGWYAFAAAPGWFLTRRQYLVTILAPFLILSLVGMFLMAILPVMLAVVVLIMTIFNATSSVGDLWIAFRLLGQRRPVVAEDLGDGVNFYSLN